MNTKRGYTTDFVAFARWCEPQGLAAVPAESRTIALYLTALAVNEKKVATIERALVAICQAHKLNGLHSPRKAPEVAEVLQGAQWRHLWCLLGLFNALQVAELLVRGPLKSLEVPAR